MRIIALVPRSVHSLLMVWLVALKPVSTLETKSLVFKLAHLGNEIRRLGD